MNSMGPGKINKDLDKIALLKGVQCGASQAVVDSLDPETFKWDDPSVNFADELKAAAEQIKNSGPVLRSEYVAYMKTEEFNAVCSCRFIVNVRDGYRFAQVVLNESTLFAVSFELREYTGPHDIGQGFIVDVTLAASDFMAFDSFAVYGHNFHPETHEYLLPKFSPHPAGKFPQIGPSKDRYRQWRKEEKRKRFK